MSTSDSSPLEYLILSKTKYFIEGQVGSLSTLVTAAQVMLDKQFEQDSQYFSDTYAL